MNGVPTANPAVEAFRRNLQGQVVLVLQGGGALGAFQAGVYQALHEAGVEPDWIIGTSIGAINASLIAGNSTEHRLERLEEFWNRMEQRHPWSLIFAVHLWNPTGPVPTNIWEVLNRQKDIQYSSRIASHITRQQQTHRLRHVISQLVKHLPEDQRKNAVVKELASYGCTTRMHVIRLLAPRLDAESHIKDVDFSPSGIRMRWDAGYDATSRALEDMPWQREFDPLEGVVLHEPRIQTATAAE